MRRLDMGARPGQREASPTMVTESVTDQHRRFLAPSGRDATNGHPGRGAPQKHTRFLLTPVTSRPSKLGMTLNVHVIPTAVAAPGRLPPCYDGGRNLRCDALEIPRAARRHGGMQRGGVGGPRNDMGGSWLGMVCVAEDSSGRPQARRHAEERGGRRSAETSGFCPRQWPAGHRNLE